MNSNLSFSSITRTGKKSACNDDIASGRLAMKGNGPGSSNRTGFAYTLVTFLRGTEILHMWFPPLITAHKGAGKPTFFSCPHVIFPIFLHIHGVRCVFAKSMCSILMCQIYVHKHFAEFMTCGSMCKTDICGIYFAAQEGVCAADARASVRTCTLFYTDLTKKEGI